ncbi:MAG TPA: heterodisulfide reductase-related iron-sulfur binding cluster [Limnochordales bacterium]|nr:heterodisulfide reductase-related iron-sulfur binding cluster [Limnochordales bacterium]
MAGKHGAPKPAPAAAIPMDQLLRCVHCGLCTSVCPTYLELGSEADSPRGRIYLMRAVAEGRLAWTADVLEHLDSCLECRACETACPAGVAYGQLLEAARADIAQTYRRPWRERLLFGLFRDALFPYPGRLKAALAPVRIGGGLLRRLAGLLPRDVRHMLALLPPRLDTDAPPLPAVIPPQGERRFRVAFLAGCVGQVLFQPANWATVRVLAANGCEVFIPPGQGCCGALHLHSGAVETARRLARRNVDAFDLDGVDAIITNAAGCGSTLKEYGQLLAGDPVYEERAARFARRVRDVTEFLAAIDLVPPTRPVRRVVAYHDACHLAHGQGVRVEPRRLLAAIPELKLVELRDSDHCCGSAGLYNILQPEMAARLLDKKMAAIRETGADTVAAGNPGCVMQIAKGVREQGLAIDVRHPVELLAEAYGL